MNEVLRLIEFLASSVFELASKQQIELDTKRAFLYEFERVKAIFDPSCIYINTLGWRIDSESTNRLREVFSFIDNFEEFENKNARKAKKQVTK